MREPSLRKFMGQALRLGRCCWEGRPTRVRSKQTARRLVLERLEDRTVLSQLLNLVSPANAVLPPSDSAGGVAQPMVSAIGRYVTFTSTAPNLVAGQVDTVVGSNVFLYDQQTGTTTLVSHVPGSAATAANGSSENPRISGDGRFIVYQGTATNLVAGQKGPPQASNVFLFDRTTGTNTLISHRFDSATTSGNGDSSTGDTTGFGFNNNTGQFLLFNSFATDLLAGQNGPLFQNLFLYDTTTDTTTLVSHKASSSLTTCNSDTALADLTPDGRSVVFESFASDVVTGQTGSANNIFLYNSTTGASRLISGVFSGTGNSPTNAAGFSGQPVISANGLIIAYDSGALDLVANEMPGNFTNFINVYSYNTLTATTALLSGADGSPSVTSHFNSTEATVSSDGSIIAFLSDSDNLIAGQTTDSTGNAYFYNTVTAKLTLISHVSNSSTAAGSVFFTSPTTYEDISLSSDGRFVTYRSTASNLVAGQTGPSGVENEFVYDGQSGQNTLVSHVVGAATSAGNQSASDARISFDGTTIAFLSLATNLNPGTTVASGGDNLFVFNVSAGTGPALISRSAFQANATSLVYGASGDGRFVLFGSNAPNVVPNQVDNNFDQDLFVLDRATGTTTLVSHVAGQPGTTGDLGSPTTAGVIDSGNVPVVSNDGNFVAFVSQARNLISGQQQYLQKDQVFLFNRLTGTVTLLSHNAVVPEQVGNGSSDDPAISADGHFVAFASDAPDLIQGYTNQQPPGGSVVFFNIYLYDTVAGTLTLVSHAAGNNSLSGDGPSIKPVLSDDGLYITYLSKSTNLISGATISPSKNVYLFNRSTGNNSLVSHAASSTTSPGNASSFGAVISADGSSVAFVSFATNLVPAQTQGAADTTNVFLYNRQTGVDALVSGANGSASATANNSSDSPAVNQDGAFVAFRSTATNLVAGQAGPGGSNIFLFQNSATPALTLVSHATGSTTTTAAGDSTVPVIDGDGRLVAYLSTATNLVPSQSGGGVNNVFGWVRTLGLNFLASGINGSPTAAAAVPSFLPIISRDPIVLFSVSGSLTPGAQGTVNGYSNSLIQITLTPLPFLDGSAAGTVVGTLSTISVLAGQLVLPNFTLPAGVAADNSSFSAGATKTDGTAPLATQVAVNVAVKSSFSILVQADTGLGLVQQGFTLTANSPTTDGVNDHTMFVAGLYHDVLGRASDNGGLNGYQTQLDASRDPLLTQIALVYVTSQEDRTKLILGDYSTFLNRTAMAAEVSGWLMMLAQGGTPEAVLDAIAGSDEDFAGQGSDNNRWLNQAYQDLLGRAPDSGAQGFLTKLQSGALTRYQVAAIITGSTEYQDRLITQVYGGFMQRAPGASELAVGQTLLSQPSAGPGQPSRDEQLQARVISLGEYFQRHGASNAGFVTSLYTIVLGRPPDGGGYNNTLQEVVNGYTGGRVSVAAAFTTSGEYRQGLVTGYFSQYLGRSSPTAAEVAGYVNLLGAGTSDEQLILDFVASDEYYQHNGSSNSLFVNALYRDLLGRTPDPGSQGFLDGLNNQTMTRAQVAGALLASLEYRNRQVGIFYQNYLGRKAAGAELAYWSGVLQQGTDEQVQTAILASGEYLQRTHPFP